MSSFFTFLSTTSTTGPYTSVLRAYNQGVGVGPGLHQTPACHRVPGIQGADFSDPADQPNYK